MFLLNVLRVLLNVLMVLRNLLTVSRYLLIALRQVLFLAALVGTSWGLQAQEDSMVGTWENLSNGDLVGLDLADKEHCTLYIERALQPRSNRACKYEAFEDRFLIFLFNEHGVCNTEADFEFLYEADAPLIRLLVSGSELILQKAQKKP